MFGEIETRTEVKDVTEGVVVTLHHYRFAATQETLTAQTTLRFRTAEDIDHSLLAAGFVAEQWYDGWDRRPFTAQDDEIVVVASVS